MYVIRNAAHGKYVAPPGSDKSYTPILENAKVYPTREAAEADRCPENEQAVSVASLFTRR